MSRVPAVVAVAVGGVLGTGLRLAVDAALPHATDDLPLGTLLVNVVGAFVLGVLVARVWPTAPDWLRAGLGAGLLGSFTTFSAVTLATVELVDAGEPGRAILTVVLTVAGGLLAAALGLRLGSRPGAGLPAPEASE